MPKKIIYHEVHSSLKIPHEQGRLRQHEYKTTECTLMFILQARKEVRAFLHFQYHLNIISDKVFLEPDRTTINKINGSERFYE